MIHTMIQTEPGLLTVADIQDIQRVAASLPDEPEDPRVQQLWDAWLSERPRRQVPPPSQRATVAPITPRYGAWLPPEARSALKRVLMVEDDLLVVPMKEGGWRSFSEMEIAAERDRFVEIVLSHAPALAGGSGDEERSRRTRIGDERPKLVVIEGIEVTTALDPYLPLRALAAYSGMSARSLRDRLTDPYHPLPHYRVGGKLLVRRSEFDRWIARYRQVGNTDVERIAGDVLRDLR
jgi:hypothetical protein